MSLTRTIRTTLVVLALGLLAAAELVAHHAFGAEFDRNAPIRLQGKIVKLEWVNPHSWIHLEVVLEDGTTEVERGGLRSLPQRAGELSPIHA